MIGGRAFLDALAEHGVGLLSGVPCSYFGAPIRELESYGGIDYVPAANEGTALATAAGAALSGVRAGVIAQNSGFGNLVNPLTSLVLPYRIGLLGLVSMRGWPEAGPGEPQHRWMGRVVPRWLDSLEVPHWTLRPGGPELSALLKEARPVLDSGHPAFVLVAKGAIEGAPAAAGSGAPGAGALTREDVVRAVLAEAGEARLMATTGYLSRTLFNLGGRDGDFYMQGSMGHIASLALGAALSRPGHRFTVLDGDGSVLMHMGALATVGHFAPENLVHVVFDNGGYESTGGQAVAASRTDLAAVARACGYREAWTVDGIGTSGTHGTGGADAVGPEALTAAVRRAMRTPGPVALVVRGVQGGSAGERASGTVTVEEIGARFSARLAEGPT